MAELLELHEQERVRRKGVREGSLHVGALGIDNAAGDWLAAAKVGGKEAGLRRVVHDERSGGWLAGSARPIK